MSSIGIIVATCDSDQRHFDRLVGELTRLDLPFAVNFDHCCADTKRLFQSHPRYIGGYENDDPDNHFDESHRQRALDVLLLHKFDWATYLDTDETFERDALAMFEKLTTTRVPDPNSPRKKLVLPDLIECVVLDLWGDEKHYRIDGPFSRSHREKLYNLRSGSWRYYHPTIHAPKLTTYDGRTQAVVLRDQRPYVLHWGIMNQEDAERHCVQWDAIYTRKVGNNPYGFYPYLRDEKNVPVLKPVPDGVL